MGMTNKYHGAPSLIILILMSLSVALMPKHLIAEGQDIIGVYFDEVGVESVTETIQLYEVVELWVIIKNPNTLMDILSILFRLELDGRGYGGLTSHIGGQNTESTPDYILAASPPLMPSEVILVASSVILVESPQRRHELYIMSIPDVPIVTPSYYVSGSPEEHVLNISSGSPSVPVAVINPSGSLPSEHSTWGGIKSTFR